MFQLKNLCQSILLLTALIMSAVQAHEPETQAVLTHHLESFGAGDVAAIMEDYTEDSVVILPNAVLKGTEQITGLFEALVQEFSQEGVTFELTQSTVVDHVAYIIWNADTPNNHYKYATDTFVIKNSKIMMQTVAYDADPKN